MSWINVKSTRRSTTSGKGGPRDGEGRGTSPLPKQATRAYQTAPTATDKTKSRGVKAIKKPMGSN